MASRRHRPPARRTTLPTGRLPARPGAGGLPGGRGPRGLRPGGGCGATEPAALVGRGPVRPLAYAPGPLLAPAGGRVHRGPCPALRLLLRNATLLVALLDVLRHPFLLSRVFGFVASWHCSAPSCQGLGGGCQLFLDGICVRRAHSLSEYWRATASHLSLSSAGSLVAFYPAP